MSVTTDDLKTNLESFLDEISCKFNEWLKTNRPITRCYHLPVSAFSDEFNDVEIPVWKEMLDEIFGKNLEKLDSKSAFLLNISKWFTSAGLLPPLWESVNLESGFYRFVLNMLKECSVNEHHIEFPDKKGLIDKCLDYFCRDSDEWFIDIPLSGISLEADVSLSGNFILRNFTDELRNKLIDRIEPFLLWRGSYSIQNDIFSCTTLLSGSYSQKRSNSVVFSCTGFSEITQLFDLSCLFGYGLISRDLFQMKSVNIISPLSYIRLINSHSLHRPLKPFVIESNDEFSQFMNLYGHLDWSRHELKFILDRIKHAWSVDFDFRVFDYVSILEAILCDETNSEISFKISLYGSFLFEEFGANRKEMFDLIKKAYNHRSCVAHCKKIKNHLTEDEMNILGSYVHKAIHSILKEGLKEFRKKAKERVLRSV